MFLAFEKMPHPNNQVKTPTLFIRDKFLCNDGFILYKASIKAVRKFSSEGVSILVGKWCHPYISYVILLFVLVTLVCIWDG